MFFNRSCPGEKVGVEKDTVPRQQRNGTHNSRLVEKKSWQTAEKVKQCYLLKHYESGLDTFNHREEREVSLANDLNRGYEARKAIDEAK